MSIANRVNTLLLLLVLFTSLALLGVLATRARGGPLDPPGAPAPSGKTLEEIPGSWSRKLPANDGSIGPTPPAGCNSTRFQCVLNNLGVLDLETGLVWTRNANPLGTPSNFGTARGVCSNLATDGRTGWRLPTLEELRSLIETTASSAPKLPSGHPFTNPQTTDSY